MFYVAIGLLVVILISIGILGYNYYLLDFPTSHFWNWAWFALPLLLNWTFLLAIWASGTGNWTWRQGLILAFGLGVPLALLERYGFQHYVRRAVAAARERK